jgi:hypothetical protein
MHVALLPQHKHHHVPPAIPQTSHELAHYHLTSNTAGGREPQHWTPSLDLTSMINQKWQLFSTISNLQNSHIAKLSAMVYC